MPNHRQSGFSLIENLIALVVMSIGLLGIASMQLSGISKGRTSFERSQATLLVTEIVERMRANLPAAEGGNYNLAAGAAAQSAASNCIGVSANCSPAELAAADLAFWQRRVNELLNATDTSIQVSVDASGALTANVTLDWGSDQLQLRVSLS